MILIFILCFSYTVTIPNSKKLLYRKYAFIYLLLNFYAAYLADAILGGLQSYKNHI